MTDLCFVVTRAPQAGHLGQETFDLAVAGGVFDQQIEVIFTGSGLLHLAAHEPLPGHKSLVKLWQSASMFGVERFVVPAAEADRYRQLQASPLTDRIEFLDAAAIQALLRSSREVMVL
ncbi:hypothetical protein E4656_04565 [Natronospirillum operosum]|uniref:Uncharacterized protein n=1 Tax=Natronospirillum operosum TaxID=2759953 RepID=A0A4Z0WAL4_9GAMM|nr:DsrE family protein [Natronospirillum operosum]TGG95689.1 hypothetical protein E4656_04565 [Natronospirillum operosum]